ncbi:MAG: hypothetical protein RDV00_00580 [Clostridia bacterium]|nr:hypothetical protein [Clostridia bacterium]
MRRFLLVLYLLLAIGLTGYGACWAEPTEHGRVVIVVLDQITLADLDHPTFEGLLSRAAVGLLNTNTGGIRNVENTHVTIGAGSRAVGTGAAFLAFDANESVHRVEAGEEFRRRTGVESAEDGVVHLGIARIQQLTSKVPSPAVAGTLGSVLRSEGLVTAVIGNADWDSAHRRHAVTIAMDQNGLVDHGSVGRDLLRRDPDFPGGYRTDYDHLIERFREFSYADLIVIETGDTSRVDEAAGEVLPEMLAAHRGAALARSAEFIDRLLNELDLSRDFLMVLVPTPSSVAIAEKDLLTPLVMAGTGVEPGLLTSASTRREGIVLNIDVAPTVLHFFNINPPESIIGRAVVSLPGAGGLDDLSQLNEGLVLTHTARVPIIKTYMSLQIGLVLIVMLSILFRDIRLIDRRYLRQLMLLVMSFPLAALLIVPFGPTTIVGMVTGLIGLTLLVGAAAVWLSREGDMMPFVFLALFTAGTIVIDLLLGSPLQKQSLLSYDPLGGARFYGLGNEYMGVLVGSAILGAATVLTRWPRWRGVILPVVAFSFAITLFTVANPQLGANMGGSITASIAFLVTFLLFLGVRFTRRVLLIGGGGVVLFLAGLTVLDFMRGAEQQSHIGRAARLVFTGGLVQGLEEAYNILNRKFAMNWKLLKYTIWSRVFLATLGGFALLFFLPVGQMQEFKQRYPDLYRGFVGIILGAIVALIVNDSGVVAAATTMIFAGLPLMYIFLEDLR